MAETDPIHVPAPPADLRPLSAPPTISVVVPAYEAAAIVGEALDSILSQTPPPHEVVVADDGSRDDLEAALEPFSGRITVLHGTHSGVAAARNAGWRCCSGDFVLFADADDLLLPGKLAALGLLGQRRPDLDLLATDMRFEVDGEAAGRFGEANAFPSEDQRQTILERCFVVQPAFRRPRLAAVGGFDESLATGEDWDCVLRMILAGSTAGLYDEPLAVYRIRTGSLTDARPRTLRDRVRILEKAAADPNLLPAERSVAQESLAVQRRRARVAAAQAAVESGSLEARRLCMRLVRTPGTPASLRLWGLALAATPTAMRPALGRHLATSTSELSRKLPRKRDRVAAGGGSTFVRMADFDPAVSVVLPVYNGERYLREAIDSVLAEDSPVLELIVVDDGSTDSTPEILADYGGRDPRVVVHREKGPTLASALNLGFGIARAPYVARLDADDVDLPGRLGAQHDFLVAHPDVVLLGGQAQLVNEDGREFATTRYPLDDAALRKATWTTNPFVHSAVMMRRSAFEAAGGYRTNLPHAEDIDLWLRLAEDGKLANLPDEVVKYRIHGGQLSLQKQVDQAIHAAAVRVSAQARLADEPDPLEGGERIDEGFLVAHGMDRYQITAAVVDSATWLGRTSGRAGYPATETELFASAYERARSESGSPALVASVHRSVARRHAEQGHRIRAKLKTAQARLTERG